MSKEVCEFLDIDHVEPEFKEGEVLPAEIHEEENEVESDIKRKVKLAEDNLLELIQESKEIVEQVARVAKQSETARIFEVAAKMLETSASLNKDLIDMQHEKQTLGIEKIEKESDNKTTVNVHLSTAEFARQLKEAKQLVE